MSVNKVLLIGNIGKIELKNGIVKASLATNNKYKSKSGEMVSDVSWHRLTFFGKLAEIAGKYLTKGSKIYAEGSIKYSKYTDANGVEKYSTDIIVRNMQMLGSKGDDTYAGNHGSSKTAYNNNKDDGLDDIPF